MSYEDIANTEKYKALMDLIPAEERAKIEEAIQKLVKDFEKALDGLKKPEK